MKEDTNKIDEAELMKAFSGFRSVRRSDLRKYYEQHSRLATDQAFRRFLYRLEKRQVIAPVGSGVYVFFDPLSQEATQKKTVLPHLVIGTCALERCVPEGIPIRQIYAVGNQSAA